MHTVALNTTEHRFQKSSETCRTNKEDARVWCKTRKKAGHLRSSAQGSVNARENSGFRNQRMMITAQLKFTGR
jgi:hypothetical protein